MRPSSPSVTLGFAAIGLGASLASLDTAVNIAFPGITSAFGLGVGGIQWVVIAYVLTYSSLMLVCGKVGDLFGYRLVFRTGLVVSTLAFVLCSLPSQFGWLLAARFLQGVGTALVLSCAPALATQLYGEARRTQALAIYGTLSAVGLAVGPSLGGVLVELWGWSAVFWFRIPIALAGLLLSFALPLAVRRPGAAGFDFFGAVLLAVTMSSLLMALVTSRLAQMPVWLPLVLGAAGLLLLVLFVNWERRVAEPILRPAIFADADFVILNVASVALYCASFSVLLLVPYFLLRGAGLSAAWGGLVLAAGAVGTMTGASASTWLVARIGRRRVALAGLVLCGVGLWACGTGLARAELALMVAALVVQGLGVGLFQVTYTDIVTATLPLRERGVAGSLSMVARTLGVVSGASVLSAIFLAAEREALATGASAASAFLEGFGTGMRTAGIGLLCVAAATHVRPSVWWRREAGA